MRDAYTQEVFDRDQGKTELDQGCINDGKLGESKQEPIRNRGKARRAGRFKIKAAKDCKCTELALAGKWIAASILWLEENTPCETSYAIEQITKFLPHSTRHGSKAIGRVRIARDAIRRAYRAIDLDEILPKFDRVVPQKKPSVLSKMIDEIKKNGPIKGRDFVNVEFKTSRLGQLFTRGKLKRQNGVYFLDGQDVSTYQKRPRKIEVNDERV